jgi:hypothetical protein
LPFNINDFEMLWKGMKKIVTPVPVITLNGPPEALASLKVVKRCLYSKSVKGKPRFYVPNTIEHLFNL